MSEENTQLIATGHPAKLIEMAISNNLDMDKLERLMKMKEEHEAREAAKSFRLAMADFQAKKPKVSKTRDADFGVGKAKYKFATLSDIQESVDPILSECGLSYNFYQSQTDTGVKMTCVVAHIMGHKEENSISAPLDDSPGKNRIQMIGSTISYLKRYTLAGALGISIGDDDDGEGGAGKDKKQKEKPELVPTMTKLWDNALTALKKGSATIDEIETRYKLSDDNRNKLLNQAV